MLVDQNGNPKGELARGQHKSIQTDRVTLVPGPDEEIEVVRGIYEAFVNEGKPETEIAASLNAHGILTDLRRPWTRGTLHQILINEKYIGTNVWNRASFKLKRKRVRNSPDMWIRTEDAFEPIVDRQLFEAAQVLVRERSARFSNEEMLAGLQRLLEQHGYLSGIIVDEAENLPSSSVYRFRFGSLLRAYELVGFRPDRDYQYVEINRTLRSMYPGIIAEAISEIESVGGGVTQDPVSDILTINGEFTASIVIARCQETMAGSLRWHIRFDARLRPDLTVAIRMDRQNSERLDYYLLPRIDLTPSRLRLAEYNGVSLDTYRFDTLDHFFQMASRSKLLEVA
jgi:hypothetical protein